MTWKPKIIPDMQAGNLKASDLCYLLVIKSTGVSDVRSNNGLCNIPGRLDDSSAVLAIALNRMKTPNQMLLSMNTPIVPCYHSATYEACELPSSQSVGIQLSSKSTLPPTFSSLKVSSIFRSSTILRNGILRMPSFLSAFMPHVIVSCVLFTQCVSHTFTSTCTHQIMADILIAFANNGS